MPYLSNRSKISLVLSLLALFAIAVPLFSAGAIAVLSPVQDQELVHETPDKAYYPSDEEVARAHAGEDHVFPDPCGLESVLCEGEEGWTE